MGTLRNSLVAAGATVGSVVLSGSVQAASILPGTFAADVADVSTDITTVIVAIIGLCLVALGGKWVKATFFA